MNFKKLYLNDLIILFTLIKIYSIYEKLLSFIFQRNIVMFIIIIINLIWFNN